MQFLASDLLYQRISPKRISEAVLKAVHVGKSSGMDIRAYFKPVFSGIDEEIISDRKTVQKVHTEVDLVKAHTPQILAALRYPCAATAKSSFTFKCTDMLS